MHQVKLHSFLMLPSHEIGANIASTYYLQVASFRIIMYLIVLNFLLAIGAKVTLMGHQLPDLITM